MPLKDIRKSKVIRIGSKKIWKMCVIGLMVASPAVWGQVTITINQELAAPGDGTYVVIDSGEWVELTFTVTGVPASPAVKLTFSSEDPSTGDVIVTYLDASGEEMPGTDECPNPNTYSVSDLTSNPYVAALPQFSSMVLEVTGPTVSLDAAEFVSHGDADVLLGTCTGGTGAEGVEVVGDPITMIVALASQVVSCNCQQGIENSLDTKLASALDALEDANANNDGAAVNKLEAFINEVEAQRGNKITDEQADALGAAAQAIIDALTAP